MTESLVSSSDFSDILEDDNTIVVTPLCPICQKNYSENVEPMILQPCCHGLCKICLRTLKNHANDQFDDVGEVVCPKCPICRGEILEDHPNYDLREITENIRVNDRLGYWEKQILDLSCMSGRKIFFSDQLKPYSKIICIRLAFDDIFVNMKMPPSLWTRQEKSAVLSMKNGIVKTIVKTDEKMTIICKWLGLLAFPIDIETYFLKYFMQWYEYKEFLDKVDGTWLLDVLTHPV
jgi:hypothetical protein